MKKLKENLTSDFKVGEFVHIRKECNSVWSGPIVEIIRISHNVIIVNHPIGKGGFSPNEIRKLTKLEKALS